MNTANLRNTQNVIHNGRNFLVTVIAAVSLVSMVHVARAADTADSRPAVTVHYSDLNLNTEAGVASLYNRIRHAAQEVCGKVDSRRLDEVAAAQSCFNRAMASSVGAVGNAQLDREYLTHVSATPKMIYVASTR